MVHKSSVVMCDEPPSSLSSLTTPTEAHPPTFTTHRDFYDAYMEPEDNAASILDTSNSTGAVADSTSKNTYRTSNLELRAANKNKLMQYIWSNVIGTGDAIVTPFGDRKITYADYTASGRSLRFIEDYILSEVLPLYANTHTLSDTTGLQTTLFRQEAREIVKRSCRCSIDDTVIFVGSGATACIDATVRILDIHRVAREAVLSGTALPIVFIGPYEHHSNILPWKEAGAKVVTIPESSILNTGLDLAILERELSLGRDSNSPIMIGSFSACSNVTGLHQDTLEPTALLRRYGALSAWDYASAAAHGPIDMNPLNADGYKKDILYFSPHKLVGGVSTPGVLCIKKRLLQRETPHRPGGGTVLFVTGEKQVYLSNFEEKEEGGTPEIVGAIRAGLAMQLRENVGAEEIYSRELRLSRNGLTYLAGHRNIEILGLRKNQDLSVDRAGIISFAIRYTPDPSLFLHHNFVAAVLNDLFGIQARAGCACAGPYVQSLMGISSSASTGFLDCIYEKMELVRPGMVRLNLSYFAPEFETTFILKAVSWIASHAWKLLPLYSYVVSSGEFKHHSRLKKTVARRWLDAIDYNHGEMRYASKRVLAVSEEKIGDEASHAMLLAQYLHDAQVLLGKLGKLLPSSLPDQTSSISSRALAMRWFVLPNEALADARGGTSGMPTFTALQPVPLPSRMTLDNAVNYIGLFNPVVGEQNDVYAHANHDSSTFVYGHSNATLNAPSRWLGRIQDSVMPHAYYRPGTIVQRVSCLEDVNANLISNVTLTDETTTLQGGIITDGVNAHPSLPSPLSLEKEKCEVCPKPQVSKDVLDSAHPHSFSIPALSPHSSSRKTEAILPATATTSTVTSISSFAKLESSMKKNAITSSSTSISSSAIDSLCQHCFHEHKVPAGEAVAQAKECLSCECVTFVPRVAASKKEVERLTKKISSLVGQAIQMFNMIKDGDRVLVGVSGGKDSLTLIHILLHLQKKAPISFHLAACTVDPQAPEYDPSLLKRYFAALGIPYYYISQGIMEQAKKSLLSGAGRNSICAFCSRMRRGILYTTARTHGYNVLALGQHLDDLSESFLMSAFYNGLLRTMKVNYTNAQGDVRIIRPLCLLRESKTREYAKACALPIINENCPACFEAPKERQRMKLLLAHQETVHPMVHQTLLKTMMPLLKLESAGSSVASLLGGGGDLEDEDVESNSTTGLVSQQVKRQKHQQTTTKPLSAKAQAIAEAKAMRESLRAAKMMPLNSSKSESSTTTTETIEASITTDKDDDVETLFV